MRVRSTFTSNFIGNFWKRHVHPGKHGKLYLIWWLYSTLLLGIPGFWLESTRPWWQAGPRVSHRGLCAHSALSPSACLFWLGCCNQIRGASVHGRYVSPSLCSRAVGLKKGRKTRRRAPGCFPPFKSTLPRAPCWPLMLPVHLAKRSGETQDHRNGQKQFHPLSEPISTTHWEGKKQKSDTSKTPVKSFWVTSPNMLSSHPLVLSP